MSPLECLFKPVGQAWAAGGERGPPKLALKRVFTKAAFGTNIQEIPRQFSKTPACKSKFKPFC